MSQAAHVNDHWAASEPAGETAKTAAATEIAVRAAVGVMAIEALAGAVRAHPWLSLFFATGVGYLLGNGWLPGVRSEPADGGDGSPAKRLR